MPPESSQPAVLYGKRDGIPWGPWYEDPAEIARLLRWLIENGQVPDDIAYFIERAKKWNEEFNTMTREEFAA